MKTLKIHICCFVLLLSSLNGLFAQNVSINEGGAEPDSSAMLDVSSRDKGILIPRMAAAERLAIVNPANGLIVFQTDGISGIYIYNSGSNLWQRLSYDSSNNIAAVLAQGSDANADTIYNLGLLGVGVNNNLLNPLNVKGPAAFIDDSLNSVGRPSASHITLYPRSFANYIESGIGTTPTRLVFQSESYSFTTGVTNFGDVGTVLQITNSGDIGIGTFTPSAKLEVAGDGSLIGGLRVSGTTSATVGASIYLNGASKDWTITATNSSAGAGTDKLVFRDYSSATDRMVIDSLGDVGIGTQNPNNNGATRNLTIAASNSYSANRVSSIELQGSQININSDVNRIDFNAVSNGPTIYNHARISSMNTLGGSTGASARLLFYTALNGVLSERMTINQNGNVGIGTSTPSALLDVEGDFQLVDGTEGAGKVLVSDANGNATWQDNSLYRVIRGLNNSSYNASTTWQPLGPQLTINKAHPNSVIEVFANTSINVGDFNTASYVQFEIRVNGVVTSIDNKAMIRPANNNGMVSMMAVFENLPVGNHTVQLYFRDSNGTANNITLDIGGFGGSIIAKETF